MMWERCFLFFFFLDSHLGQKWWPRHAWKCPKKAVKMNRLYSVLLMVDSLCEGMVMRTVRGRGVSLERSRGLPMVGGRSSKHALSWQTLGWSWRAGWAPGGCLCASDGRGGDYHQHSASPPVLREEDRTARVELGAKESRQPHLGIWKSTVEEGADPLLLPPHPCR